MKTTPQFSHLHTGALALCVGVCVLAQPASATPPNVLFITVDDLRPELPAYGATHVQTPCMDRLSSEGLTFNRAYVQQAICQPSRDCVLTGARPDTTRIYNVFESSTPTFRTTMGAVATLPSVFKNNGYWTAGYGKNFHHVDNASWTVSDTFYSTSGLYQDPVNKAIAADADNRPPWENYAGNEADYMDAKVAAAAVQAIRDRAVDGQPFFIAAGFWKPHLPFVAPKQYWDLYDRNTLPIATGRDALPVAGALPKDFYDPYSGELGTYKGGKPPFVAITPETQAALENGTFTTNQQTGANYGIITVNGTHIYPEDYARALTHGYYSCTSFVDAQIGKILAALEDPNNDGNTSDSILNNTIVVLWGDHGMQLGRHGSWPKHTNMDVATRIPFIIHHPGMPAGTRGVMTNALMESVDIMPTLLEMANLPAPGTHALEGRSLVPLMADPHQTWKTAAFSQYPKEVPMGSGTWFMGYAMRTATHTYTLWREMQATDSNPISLAARNFTISNTVAHEELYDMVADQKQNQNIGADPEMRPLMDAYKAMLNTALTTGYANTQNVGSTTPAAPEARAVAFVGGTDAGDTLTAHYHFADANGDAEQPPAIEWVRADAFAGPYDTVVGTGATYTLQAADEGKFVKLRVTPQADTAPVTGTAVLSATAVVAGVGFDDGTGQPAPESAIYEGFDYTAGTISSSSAGGRGWASGWWGNDALSFGANSGSQAVDFAWSSLPAGYHHTPTGRAAGNGANANNPFRQFAAGQTIDLAQNGTRYFSFLYRHNGSATTFEQRFHAGTTEVLKLQINASGSLSLISPNESKMGLLTLDASAGYVILGRIQSVASGNDTLSVSIYKTGDTVPAEPPVFAASVNVTSSAVIDRLFFGNPYNSSNLGNAQWDELHIDTNYASVVGAASGGEAMPIASEINVTGNVAIGSTLTASYTFTYSNGSEGTSTFQWYRADSENGTYAAITGATAATYTLTAPDEGKWVRFGVTPIGQDSIAGTEVFGTPVGIPAGVAEPNLLLHLTFDAGTLADSSSANLAVTGTVGFVTADGRSCATFDGTSNSLKVPMLRTFPDGITIAFWTLAQDGANGMPKNTALGWARQSGGDGTLIAPGYNNTNKHIFRIGRSGTTNDEVSTGSALTGYLNTWVHWAITKDPASGTMKLYRDGVEVGSATGKTIIPEFVSDSNTGGSTGGFLIGKFWTAYYKGYLDDYRIYDSSLTAAQVLTLYQESAATDPTAFNVAVSGTPAQVGSPLTATYEYAGGTQGTSLYQWFRSGLETGPWVEISGATALSFTPTSAEDGGYVRFRVIPKNNAGTSGEAVWSSPILVGTFVNRTLANTVHRIQAEHSLNVVFLGGSITEGVGQNNGLPYRTRIMNWLQSTYPETTFNFTSAAISGTGSEFGVFRTDRHVLAHSPDLVFIEFAVNDAEQEQVNWTYLHTDDRIRASMEGIVRKIRAARPSCDIVFLYTTTVAMATNYYEGGQLPPKTLVHKAVAEHHGIPQIDLAQALVAHKQSTGYPYRIPYGEPGAFSPTANHYLPDYVHPSNLGHQVYGDAAQAALTTLLNLPTPAALVNHPVPAPLSPLDLTGARILDHNAAAVTYGSGWTPSTLSISNTKSEVFQTTAMASNAGAVSVSFSGTELGVFYKRSSSSGQVSWATGSHTGEKSFNDANFSAPGFTSYAMLSTGLDVGSHVATITPQAVDANENLAIAGWLVLGEAPPRTPGLIRILALGDSITYGLSFGEANGQTAFPCGYRGPLQNLLQADTDFTNNFDFLGNQKTTNTNAPGSFDKTKATADLLRYDGHHQGHPSYTIKNMYAGSSSPPPGNIYSVLTTSYTAETFDPDIVLLHIGINDIIAQGATAASIQQDYRDLVAKIYEFQPGVELYVSTIMINHPNHPNFSQVLAFNTWLRDVEVPYWQSQGKFIRLVDMFAALQDQGYSSTLPSTNVNYGTTASPNDRTHPNHTGYANMAAAWSAALTRPHLVSAPAITSTLLADATFSHLAGGASHPDAAPEADPDGDGIPNFMEYALAGNPLSPGDAMLPGIDVAGSSLRFSFFRAASDLTYEVLASSDLVSWDVIAINPGVVGSDVTVTDPEPVSENPRRFLRLRVTR